MRKNTASPNVLFLCVHNAGRSQMAAGFLRHLTDGQVAVFSAGSEPSDAINPAAMEVMAEKGIDLGGQSPRRWDDEMVLAADVVITMGCGDSCPYFPGRRYLDWEVGDPSGEPIEKVREIRDEIEARVRDLIRELGVAG